MTDDIQYLSQEKYNKLKTELADLKETKITGLAKRIDDARQMGDLSENAEYHAAREEMAWVQSRVKEIEQILSNAEIMPTAGRSDGAVNLSSRVTVHINGATREYTIVGAQEADPVNGKISNESPLGMAFMGRSKGEKVEVVVPAGKQVYEIIDVA